MIPAKPVEFRFARAWQHAGVLHKPGDTVELAPATAAMLAELGAGERIKSAKTPRRGADDATGNIDTTGE